MGRLRATFVCALVLACAGASDAYAGVRDFEMKAPGGGVSAAARGPYKSHVLRAPARFNLVGMRWRGTAKPTIALRARKAGARWSKWTRVPAESDDSPDLASGERLTGRGYSSPVWTGDADYLQFKVSRRVPRLRLHFVSVSRGTRKELASRSAQASRRAAASRKSGATGSAPPAIQPRAAWGAENCAPRKPAAFGDVKMAFIHHTVSANDYTAAEVPAIILSICRYHRNSNGWDDIGYNFLVDKFGTLWEGRAGGIDQPVVGAQAQGYNSQSTGIADIGTHQDVGEGNAALDAIARLVRWKLPLHGAPTSGTVTLTSGGGELNRYKAGTQVTFERLSGHRDGGSTQCPGNALYAQLPELRRRIGDVQPTAPAQSRTLFDVSLSPAAVVYPQQATISGALRQIDGSPVAGAALDVQAYGDSGWRTTWHATTGDDGGFRLDVGARLSHQVRVRYAGDGSRLSSVSKTMLLKVVPELTLQRSAARKAVGQTVTLSGSVQPSKTRLVLYVERRAGKKKSTGTLVLRARKGKFARTYKFDSSGLFRFYVAFAGDKGNAAARSSAVYVRALPPVAPQSTEQGGVGDGTRSPTPTSGGGVNASGGAVAARRR